MFLQGIKQKCTREIYFLKRHFEESFSYHVHVTKVLGHRGTTDLKSFPLQRRVHNSVKMDYKTTVLIMPRFLDLYDRHSNVHTVCVTH